MREAVLRAAVLKAQGQGSESSHGLGFRVQGLGSGRCRGTERNRMRPLKYGDRTGKLLARPSCQCLSACTVAGFAHGASSFLRCTHSTQRLWLPFPMVVDDKSKHACTANAGGDKGHFCGLLPES